MDVLVSKGTFQYCLQYVFKYIYIYMGTVSDHIYIYNILYYEHVWWMYCEGI